MNPTPIILGAVAIVGAAEAGAQERARPAEQITVTLKVSGMSCSVCAATVERVAKRVRGVTAANASQPRGTADITYDANLTTADEIAKFLNKNSGFKVNAAPKAR